VKPAVFRRARIDEADVIAETHVATWKTAYRGLLPDAMLDSMHPKDRVPRWERALRDPEAAVFVAEIDGRVVGFLAVCRFQEDASGRTGELDAIYILEAFAGQGIGASFQACADRWMNEQGFTRAILWVLPANAGARRFYESHGWTDDAIEKTLGTPDGEVPARRYSRSLA
jgi:GNAT superfamily N-acetyltransferase